MATASATERMESQDMLKVPDVCRRLNLARSTVYSLMDSGALAFAKFGRARRIPAAALDAFVKRNTFGA